jgi:hypothetical protein
MMVLDKVLVKSTKLKRENKFYKTINYYYDISVARLISAVLIAFLISKNF